LRKIFIIWYANFLLTLVNLAYTIFWYEHIKDGIGLPENNVGKLYYSKYGSWNNPNGQKPLLGTIVINF
jgi:hypothetical protein